MSRTILILRGCSGNGKSFLAETLQISLDSKLSGATVSADDYMVDSEGNYSFHPSKLGFCHKSCQDAFKKAIEDGVNQIVVSNTNVKYSDFKFYLETWEAAGYKVFVLVVENYHGNKDIHGLNDVTLERQEKSLRGSLKLR